MKCAGMVFVYLKSKAFSYHFMLHKMGINFSLISNS